MGTVPQDTPTPESRLDHIDVPVLITNGDLDPGVPVANARTLAEPIPGARLSIYAGSSHGMMFQDAERFAAEVAAFRDSTVTVSA